jgi:hypothetical protein
MVRWMEARAHVLFYLIRTNSPQLNPVRGSFGLLLVDDVGPGIFPSKSDQVAKLPALVDRSNLEGIWFQEWFQFWRLVPWNKTPVKILLSLLYRRGHC